MYQNTIEFALKQDAEDKLSALRSEFLFPQWNGKDCIYLTGNSLGLQPKNTELYLKEELADWHKYGVEGHFHAKRPWFHYHEFFSESLSKIIGCKPEECVAMGSLTANLHLLLVSFYRPDKKRFKIICEQKPFPSDTYAFASQIRFHGFDPAKALIELKPREGEYTLRTEDILAQIDLHKDELALVCLGAVQYFTGQFFDLKQITRAAHQAGAKAGFDLAHAAANVPLELHDWDVDFACWCSYKYMNSGPGGVAGIYVHEKYSKQKDIARFEGWWGNDAQSRFLMKPEFEPMAGAAAWQLSNAPVFTMACHRAALDIFDKTSMQDLRQKSRKLTGYLAFLLEEIRTQYGKDSLQIITPHNEEERGAQLSLVFPHKGKEVFENISKAGIIADWREPNVMRIAPVPLYNSFEDVYRFANELKKQFS